MNIEHSVKQICMLDKLKSHSKVVCDDSKNKHRYIWQYNVDRLGMTKNIGFFGRFDLVGVYILIHTVGQLYVKESYIMESIYYVLYDHY